MKIEAKIEAIVATILLIIMGTLYYKYHDSESTKNKYNIQNISIINSNN